MSVLIAVIGGGMGGFMTILLSVLQRRWAKKDEKEKQAQIDPKKIDALSKKLDNVIEAQKVIIIDRVQYLGSCYIYAEEITLDAKENIHAMHKAYKGLGGNGDLDIIMEEVDKLRITESTIKKKKET